MIFSNKKLKNNFMYLFFLLFLVVLVGCQTSKSIDKVEKIEFESDKMSIGLSDNYDIEYTVFPLEYQGTELLWDSSDESIVLVDSRGNIRAVGVGEAIITVESLNEVTADIKVVVYYKPGDKFQSEIEPNSSINTANLIKDNGITILGELTLNDFDIYKVYLSEGMTITGIINPEYSLDVPYYIMTLVGTNEVEEGFLSQSIPMDDSRIFSYTVSASDYYYIWIYYSNNSPYILGGSYIFYVWWDK